MQWQWTITIIIRFVEFKYICINTLRVLRFLFLLNEGGCIMSVQFRKFEASLRPLKVDKDLCKLQFTIKTIHSLTWFSWSFIVKLYHIINFYWRFPRKSPRCILWWNLLTELRNKSRHSLRPNKQWNIIERIFVNPSILHYYLDMKGVRSHSSGL